MSGPVGQRGPWRLEAASDAPFPPVETALRDPDGLLAVGGDLSLPRLRNAYAGGIFPWFSPGQPILWWSPDPRTVFRTDAVHLSSRFRRSLRRSRWVLRADTAFEQVLEACARAPRRGQSGTWIVPQMAAAYRALHLAGEAHSVEVFDDDRLVGGVYGVSIGRMFFGESMFSAASGGSKVALAGLAAWLQQHAVPLIDAQVENAHLVRMGACTMPRGQFVAEVARLAALPPLPGCWRGPFGSRPAHLLAAPAQQD